MSSGGTQGHHVEISIAELWHVGVRVAAAVNNAVQRIRLRGVTNVWRDDTMQGIVNIASFAFFAGAFGQQCFYGRFPLHMPQWLVCGVLFLPWLAVYVISFCNAAPFGPRPYRLILIGAMCWYGALVCGAEIGQHVWRVPSDGHIPLGAARCLMYFGCLSFIPFVLAIRSIRRFEKARSANKAVRAGSEPSPGAAS